MMTVGELTKTIISLTITKIIATLSTDDTFKMTFVIGYTNDDFSLIMILVTLLRTLFALAVLDVCFATSDYRVGILSILGKHLTHLMHVLIVVTGETTMILFSSIPMMITCIQYVRCRSLDQQTKTGRPGPRLNIKTVLSTYGNFHVKDKTAVRTSYLLHGNRHTW